MSHPEAETSTSDTDDHQEDTDGRSKFGERLIATTSTLGGLLFVAFITNYSTFKAYPLFTVAILMALIFCVMAGVSALRRDS